MIALYILSQNGIKKMLTYAKLFSKAKDEKVYDEIIVLLDKAIL